MIEASVRTVPFGFSFFRDPLFETTSSRGLILFISVLFPVFAATSN